MLKTDQSKPRPPGAVWVASAENGRVVKIDPATNRITASTSLHATITDLAVGNGSVWVSIVPDNVVYRLGFAASRAQARQIIRHGHFQVNGRRVNIPSYQVRPDDVIMMRPGSPAEQVIRDATDLTASVTPWLQADHDGLTGKILKWPERGDIDTPVQESLIVELYSK